MTRPRPRGDRPGRGARPVRAPAPSGPPPSNDLLIVGYDREPDTLNRFSTHILEDIQTCVIEGLTITDEHMNVIPLLAAEVPTLDNGGVRLRADGGMDVTWKLRPGVKWHDGTPLTSADVKFTVEAINDPSYNPESTDGFDRIASVDTPDPLTAVVHYREIYAPYALQFVRGTLPKHVLQGRDIDTRRRLQPGAARHRSLPRGRMEERRIHPARARAQLLARRRVPEDPADPLSLHRQHQHAHQPAEERRSAPGGDVPVGQVPRSRRRSPGSTVHRTPGNAYEHVTLNERPVPAFRDVRVRRALMHAIDRDADRQDDPRRAGAGDPRPDSTGVVGVHGRHHDSTPFDPAQGDRRCSPRRDGAGRQARRSPSSRRPDSPSARRVAQVLQRQFRDVGVDMKIELHDGTTISAIWFEGKFDAMLHWWQMPADPELTLFFAADRTPPRGPQHQLLQRRGADRRWSTPPIAPSTSAERTRLLGLAQQRIAELLPELPLYGITKLDAIPAGLQGFKGNPTNAGVFWNVHEWEP